MKIKRTLIILLSALFLLGVGFTVFKSNSNQKYENSHKTAFVRSEIDDDLKYLLNEPLTLTNRIVTDEEIEKYKKTDEVYIIKSPKRLGIKADKKIKKIIFIKTDERDIVVIYYRNHQEVRIK